MAASNATDKATSWAWKNSNVINYDRGSFLSASRCVVYAQQATSGRSNANLTITEPFYPIGLIQSYNWNEQRQVDMVFELGSEIPFLVPGRTTGQLSLQRMLIYGRDLVNVLYYDKVNRGIAKDYAHKQREYGQYIKKSLKDIDKPLNLMFAMFPINRSKFSRSLTVTKNANFYCRVFRNCWITSRGESLSAGQSVIAEQVSILYEDVTRLNVAADSENYS